MLIISLAPFIEAEIKAHVVLGVKLLDTQSKEGCVSLSVRGIVQGVPTHTFVPT